MSRITMRVLVALALVLGLTATGTGVSVADDEVTVHEAYGNVYDAVTGEGVGGVVVDVFGGPDLTDPAGTVVTRDDGYGSWTIDLPDGDYRYRTARAGYSSVTGTFTVDGAIIYLGFVELVESRGDVQVSVALEFSGPASCAFARAYAVDGGGEPFGTYGGTGDRVEFRLPVGDYRFWVGDDCVSPTVGRWVGPGATSFETAATGTVRVDGTVDLGSVLIDQGSRLSGRVTDSTSASAGLRAIDVELVPVDGVEGAFRGSARTGTDGRFTIVGVPDGAYDLRAFDGLGDYRPSETTRVTVTGSDLVRDLQMVRKPASVDVPLLKGTVTAADGAGIADVAVELYAVTDPETPVLVTRTRRDGSYSVASPTKGSYRVRFVAPDEGPGGYVSEWFDNRASFAAATTVVLADRTVTVGAVLSRLGSLSGRVTVPAGTGAADVQLTLYDIDGDVVDRTTAAPDGTYTFLGVPPASYLVRADASLGTTLYIRQFWSKKYSLAAATRVAVASTAKGGVDFVMGRQLTVVTAPKVTGTAKKGRTLTVSAGTWSMMAGTGFTYQWYRGTTAIKGATKTTYVATTSDVGKKLRVVVTASDRDRRWLPGSVYTGYTATVVK